jgi:rSAM/selenodomain-associated transferase 2
MILSIIIPVLNEAASIAQLLKHLTRLKGQQFEIIVADGGSCDETRDIVSQFTTVKLINSPRGRAKQMNTGAAAASGETLLFMHADTQISANFIELEKVLISLSHHQWGFFKVSLSGQHWMYRVIESMINVRSSMTCIATGDQCIFIVRDIFDSLKGYKDIPLMEDIELTSRLRRHSKPLVISQAVTTSSRRWECKGIVATITLMWCLRFLYFIGVSPKTLAKIY